MWWRRAARRMIDGRAERRRAGAPTMRPGRCSAARVSPSTDTHTHAGRRSRAPTSTARRPATTRWCDPRRTGGSRAAATPSSDDARPSRPERRRRRVKAKRDDHGDPQAERRGGRGRTGPSPSASTSPRCSEALFDLPSVLAAHGTDPPIRSRDNGGMVARPEPGTIPDTPGLVPVQGRRRPGHLRRARPRACAAGCRTTSLQPDLLPERTRQMVQAADTRRVDRRRATRSRRSSSSSTSSSSTGPASTSG